MGWQMELPLAKHWAIRSGRRTGWLKGLDWASEWVKESDWPRV